MNDRWGNAENFVVVGILFILVAWLVMLTNEIAELADWSAETGNALAPAIEAVVILLVALAYQSQMGIYDFVFSERQIMWRDSIAGVGFVAFGVVVGGQLPILVGIAIGLLLQGQFIQQRVAPKIPEACLRRFEEAVDE